MLTPPSQPPSSASGIQIGDVDGNLNVTVGRDWVGRDKIVNITKTTTIQISVEAVTQKPLVTASPYRGLDRFEDRDKDLFFGRDQLLKSLLAQIAAETPFAQSCGRRKVLCSPVRSDPSGDRGDAVTSEYCVPNKLPTFPPAMDCGLRPGRPIRLPPRSRDSS